MNRAISNCDDTETHEIIDYPNWYPYTLLDFFHPIRGNQKNMAILDCGTTPLVSAKKNKNGYKGFVNASGPLYSGNCLSLNNDGDGGAGIAYYQPSEMALDTHVTALYPRKPMSRWTMLFIATSITKQREAFGHGRAIDNQRLRKMKIMLPQFNTDCELESLEELMRERERDGASGQIFQIRSPTHRGV